MGQRIEQSPAAEAWALAARQHGVLARWQLLELGLSATAIHHRITTGRLHPTWRGIYAVGRPQLTELGTWMAAVLSCGPCAALSHRSAAALWGILPGSEGHIEVSVPVHITRRRPGIVVHRRSALVAADIVHRRGIPVTAPVCTLIDLAAVLPRDQLEASINEADKRGLSDPETLRRALEHIAPRPGVAPLRATLDRRTFVLTDSQLERRFLPIARRAGLPPPRTGQYVNGFKVDFYWPELALVVETDGLRYHRTPAQQTRDRERDQAHTASGLTPLRFTHAQIAFGAEHVRTTLATIAQRAGKEQPTTEGLNGP